MTRTSIGAHWLGLGVGSVATGATLLMLGLLKAWGIPGIPDGVDVALFCYLMGLCGWDIALACKGYDRMSEVAP